MEDVIAIGVDAVVFYPANPQGAIPAVAKANAAKIPIMAVNTAIGEKQEAYPGTFAFVGHIEEEVGQLAGELALEALGGKGGNAVIIEGKAGDSIVNGRTSGFKKALEGKNVKIIAQQNTDWTKEDALRVMEDILQANPKIDVVFAHADNLAAGAIKAIEEAGRLSEIKVVATGGSKEGIENIKNGKQYGTLFYSPFKEGYMGVEAAIKYLKGEKVPSFIKEDNPKVTKENVDQFKAEW